MEFAIRLVNRAAITITPKQPYIDWANALDHDGPKIVPEHLPERSVYLVEDMADFLVDVEMVVKRYFREIFKHELEAWDRLERDFATFRQWFEVELHSMVLDMHNDSIDTEPFEA